MPQPTNKNLISSKEYTTLLSQVKSTLIDGQKRIEQERVRTYWETGDLVLVHIIKYKDRADYGKEILGKLAKDLGIEGSLLRRCLQFREQYPELPIRVAPHKLAWTHYLKLITVADSIKRTQLENQASENNWSSDELAARIKETRPSEESVETEGQSPRGKSKSSTPLVPLRGEVFTYRVVKRPTIGAGEDVKNLLLDLGFGVFRNCDKALGAFSEGDIVFSQPKNDAYKFVHSTKTAKDLFTYNAFVERVIDGDTIKVRLDLGFDTWVRETLRLRGIDAPEMDTKEGQSAKTFVQSYVKEAQQIVVRSSRSDKYDRYLADIFIPLKNDSDPTTDIFLNNLLLENNHAVRWE